ncbi:hypothetical protein G7Y89_g3905 [Cudoniella acicularis]|uniref:FAD-binding domain-containing protein n=1 Tax=Cudoniella acicularis TaxID=354080 RepID=A0A8H4W5H7_9HELO|nr:hypothetical protein G7Y89_g3905 [Cudoniella acicularis]
MATEDGATLAACLARAKSVDEIPRAMKAYEKIRKPRAEKIKGAAEGRGKEDHLPDGEEQERRDEILRGSLGSSGEISEETVKRVDWIYGFDVLGFANEELDKIFKVNGKFDRSA